MTSSGFLRFSYPMFLQFPSPLPPLPRPDMIAIYLLSSKSRTIVIVSHGVPFSYILRISAAAAPSHHKGASELQCHPVATLLSSGSIDRATPARFRRSVRSVLAADTSVAYLASESRDYRSFCGSLCTGKPRVRNKPGAGSAVMQNPGISHRWCRSTLFFIPL